MGFRGKSFGPVIIYRAEDYLQTAAGESQPGGFCPSIPNG
jgi:hypothetical protein